MLKNIPKALSPELLKILCEMGHGDEIVIADGNFPSSSMNTRVIRADGIHASVILEGILTLMPLDQYDSNNFILMEVVKGDRVVPVIWKEYEEILSRFETNAQINKMERFMFYERAKKAYAVIATGEPAQYANIILKKGCIIGE